MTIASLKKSRLAYAWRWGIRGSWHRRFTAPRILDTPPCALLDDARCEVHMMTCARDWIAATWALKSFYAVSGANFKLCLHDDGTLQPDHMVAFRTHFPGVRILPRTEADRLVLAELEHLPTLRAFRGSNVFGPKLTDYTRFAEAPKILSLDSDVLFFGRPDALLKRMTDTTFRNCAFNPDITDNQLLSGEMLASHGMPRPLPRINAGLAVMPKDALPWEELDTLLRIPGILDAPPWLIEQQLVAICATRRGAELLPEEYALFVGPCPETHRVRHYFGGTCGGIRHLMYREGIPRLVHQGILRRSFRHA